ncbi:MAG: PAS domain S-box protein [Syntrophobacteraceae bacterium]|nr:PAS domain S-box protein [Syntrophobacteraceae bacterium]
MHKKRSRRRITDIDEVLVASERKIDILTNLLKEASAEFDRSLEKITVSEGNFRAIFENAPEGIMVLDKTSRKILDCNPFIANWLGYSREEFLSIRYDDLLEGSGSKVEDNIQKIQLNGMIRAIDRRLIKKDGAVVDAEITGTTMRYRGQTSLVILARDVSERKRAENALLESEQRFRDIATYVPDWIWEINGDWKYTYSSVGVEKILGFRSDEMIGKPIWERMPKEDKKALLRVLAVVRKRPFAFKLFESRRRHRDGHFVRLESSGVPLLDDSGNLIGYRGIHRDVTERKQLEEFSRYKELFENVSDPVFISDFRGRFLEVNDVGVERLGYTRESVLGMRLKSFVPENQRVRMLQAGERIRMGKSVQFELEMRNCAGDTISFEVHARPIIYKGQPAVLSVGRDLSTRKQLERVLVMTERLSAVGEMASGVAHNFNNLLQMILGSADAAAAKLSSGNVRAAGEAIGKIQETSLRAAEVVRRIKDFTHFREDDASGKETSFDLCKLLEDALQLTQPLWKDLPDSRKYDVRLIKADSCYAIGKPSEVYEVIVNLIKNGLEAMPGGGILTLSVEAFEDRIYFRISDTGHGIAEKDLQRVFEPFFTTKGLKSSGLGLSSSYGIIKRHQGEIQVESRVGRGTTFTVILPHTDVAPIEKATPAERREAKNIRFLMIDDEVNILKAMEMFFEDNEVDLVTCRTAVEGLETFKKGCFDVILCDLGMDDVNGWEFGKQIKTYCLERKIPKVPFLLYTGWDKFFDPAKMEESGVDRVVVKPVPCHKLLDILTEVTSQGAAENGCC